MKKNLRHLAQLTLIVTLLLGTTLVFGQGNSNRQKKPLPQVALDHINKNKQKLKVSDKDIADLELSSESESKKSGVKHYYIKQQFEGIEIHGAITNMSVTQGGEVVNVGNRFHEGIEGKVNSRQPALDAAGAVAAAARHLGVSVRESLTVLENSNGRNKEVLLSKGGISLEPIPAKLVYQPVGDALKLAWEVSIYELDAQNWWNIRVDAATGEVLDKDNMVVHCLFENDGAGGKFLHETHSHAASSPLERELDMAPYAPVAGPVNNAKVPGIYEVYPMPVESPSHGARRPVSGGTANRTASPDGWHTVGQNTYNITRGNNVYAYEDPNNTGFIATNNDITGDVLYGYSPDGGSKRTFRFPVDFSKQPEAYRDAAITNLFYWNNIIHDVWYQYGFDEESGNFQASNFGKLGLGNDYVMAEAQDGRNVSTIRNNANFATPIDGRRPRMQMYLWSGIPDADMFRVTSPASIAGSYQVATASFGPVLSPTPVTGKLVLVNSQGLNPVEGCGPVLNAADVAGNIAVVYRGNCPFVDKVQNAQNAGAIAVVVINNAPGAPGAMGGASATVTIPSIMISDVAGASIRALLDANQEVVVSLKNDGSGPEIDGDFDNGIIVHEYGHGISNRLTGGPNTTSCLGNAEQMGEGWSDWFGLMMTMKPGDTREKIRGIGTYAVGQSTEGRGIRPAPYTTDFSVNNYTYGATNNPGLAAPHGVGFVFATILWEMTWDLIDQYGFDENLYNGKGGNNMAMQLVIDGLKLQACRPGFVNGRDAILLADQLNYGGANQELIWRAFARRGLGFSASQGLSTSRLDQVEAFDLPEEFSVSVASPALAASELRNDRDLISYPNPFTESTTIRFTAREAGYTLLKVYDITGREVETLFEGDVESGATYDHSFQATGRKNGMYIYKLVNGGTTRSGTMLLMK